MRIAVFFEVKPNDESITFGQIQDEILESGELDMTVYLDGVDDFAFELKPDAVELIG